MKFRHCCLATATLLSILYVPVQAGAGQSWQSPAAAEALLQHLETTNTDAIAVRDPERPERFIAALRLPGQLLVVSATHPTVDLLQARLTFDEALGLASLTIMTRQRLKLIRGQLFAQLAGVPVL